MDVEPSEAMRPRVISWTAARKTRVLEDKEIQTFGGQPGRIDRLLMPVRAHLSLFTFLVGASLGLHSALMIGEGQQVNVYGHEAKGTGKEGEFRERTTKINEYTVNHQPLMDEQVTPDRQADFEEKFYANFKELSTREVDTELLSRSELAKQVALHNFKIHPQKPEQISVKSDEPYACHQWVLAAIVEATVQTYKEMGLKPPESLSIFGLRGRENIQALTPHRFRKVLVARGILARANTLMQTAVAA